MFVSWLVVVSLRPKRLSGNLLAACAVCGGTAVFRGWRRWENARFGSFSPTFLSGVLGLSWVVVAAAAAEV